MKNVFCILALLFISMLFICTECSFADVEIGNLKFKDDGSIVFSDNSVQTSATVQGPQGPQGPQGTACSPLGVICAVGEVYLQTASGIECGQIKPFNNSIGTCIGSNCILSCPENMGNCDNIISNGCESSLLQDQNCGICGNVCQNGFTCVGKTCIYSSILVNSRIGGVDIVNNSTFHLSSLPLTNLSFYTNMPAFIYYTVDGTEPTTASSMILNSYNIPAITQTYTVLKFFGIDSATQSNISGTKTIIIQFP